MKHLTGKLIMVITLFFIISPMMFSQTEPLPWLHQGGAYIYDESGTPVKLKGVNLGNWLILEMWMSNHKDNVSDHYTMEQVLINRFGETEKNRLMDVWYDNYITDRDFQIIKSFGMNVIRLPFWSEYLMDSYNNPYVLKANAFKYLDWAVNKAESYGMYVILDMHGAPGCQSAMDHSGRADYNQLFYDTSLQEMTVWLWRQIADRYKDRSCVAAYDILNEPWGATAEKMEDLSVSIYNAIRSVDQDHIVIFPTFYNDMGQWDSGTSWEMYGFQNVALWAHPYPGFFGNGDPTIATHVDWLTNGVTGYRNFQHDHNVALLMGEFNVVLKEAGGGEMMRHAYETYNGYGWAATMWSYKVFTDFGGIGAGSWGMVTNKIVQPRLKADTWGCDNWDSSFDALGVRNDTAFTAPTTGVYYIILKAGAWDGTCAIGIDEVSFVDNATGQEKIVNGGFGSGAGWNEWNALGTETFNYNYDVSRGAPSSKNPSGGNPPCLVIGGTGQVNGGVYQALSLDAGHSYTISGVSKDMGATNSWLEIYITPVAPVNGQDFQDPEQINFPDMNSWSSQDIENYFSTLSSMPYAIDEDLQYWLTTSEWPSLYNQPIPAPLPNEGGADPTPVPTSTPTPTSTPDPTTTLNPTSTPEPTPTPVPTSGAEYCSVSSVVPSIYSVNKRMKKAVVTVTVLDNSGTPVAGATVTGTFSGDASGTASAVTDANGVTVVENNSVQSKITSFAFCVDSVAGPLPYDPAANGETCDSY
ncbi:MAG: cellulase family glycosylhydrolase [Spirochaetales bacterium]|nr:cellulase family glycosylhydrolase [Spirochaetales bacterium]